jgi:ribosomal protein S18 acetylase RimI-like enzyme
MLLDEAVAFCRASGFQSVFLWTVRDLEAAVHLYRAAGFRLKREETRERWGATVTEQRYELTLGDG